MKVTADVSTMLAWPHGFLVEVCDSGLLLKPRSKPRAGWSKSFDRPAEPKDEAAALRE
ncbi:MAG: hypothetical protein ACO1TE_20455 [Prosthecobacter sp.]